MKNDEIVAVQRSRSISCINYYLTCLLARLTMMFDQVFVAGEVHTIKR